MVGDGEGVPCIEVCPDLLGSAYIYRWVPL